MSEKREKLEIAATESVQRSGFGNLSFRTLADEVGIKSSSVHYYFPEKSHLAHAVIEKYSREFSLQLEAIGARKLSPIGKLDAFVKIFEDVLKDGRFCLCGMMAAEVDSLDSDSRQALVDYFQCMEDWLTLVIEEGSDGAALDLKPRTLARAFVSGLEGALLVDRLDGRRDRLRAQRELMRNVMI